MTVSGYIYLPYGIKKDLLRSADGDVVGELCLRFVPVVVLCARGCDLRFACAL